jgi:O-antigen/teichoic acid export membrane protein
MTRNLLWQSIGQGLGKIFTLFFYILLPKSLGLENYGEFTFIWSVAFISYQPFVEMGLDIQLTKWVSRQIFSVAYQIIYLRIFLGILLIVVNLILGYLFQIHLSILLWILLYLFLFNWQNAHFAFWRGLERMRYEAVVTPLQKLCALVALSSLGKLNFTQKLIAPLSLSLSILPGLLFISWKSWRFFQSLTQQPADYLSYRKIIKEGIVMGAASFLWLVYFRIDSVMLGVLSNNSETGIYNLAYKLMEAPIFFPSIIMTVIFPKLALPQQFKKIFNSMFIVLSIVGVLAFIILYVGADLIINFVYGSEFLAAIDVLKILALTLIPIYIGHLTTQSLIALDLSKTYLLIVLLGTIINITLNYWFILRLGAVGAAWTTLLTELLVMSACGFFVLKTTHNINLRSEE